MGKVTVLVPTHRRPELIKRALASIEAQTVRPMDVIIIGNGMSNTEFLEYELDEVMYGVFNYPNFANVAQALQFGLAHVSTHTDYVAVLEDDDEWLPGFIEMMSAALDARPNMSMVYCDEVELDNEGVQVDYTGHPEMFSRSMLFRANWIHFPVQMWRYDSLVSSGGFSSETSGAADWDIALRMSAMGVYHLKEILTIHHWLTDRFDMNPQNNCLDPEKMRAANMWIEARKKLGVYN